MNANRFTSAAHVAPGASPMPPPDYWASNNPAPVPGFFDAGLAGIDPVRCANLNRFIAQAAEIAQLLSSIVGVIESQRGIVDNHKIVDWISPAADQYRQKINKLSSLSYIAEFELAHWRSTFIVAEAAFRAELTRELSGVAHAV